ncbi:MAG: sugar ABC transporter ATP-binding protein, partial [Chloroflexota bacterium]|nr:sugar ABC transporter ATP-binding protein [Chloroflexota bacterium]
MKVLSGVYAPDGGTIEIGGAPVTLTNPHQAQALGISIIYQEFNLFPNMSVEENVFIGREPSRAGVVDRRVLRRNTRELLDRVGVRLDPKALVSDLSVAQQQMVEIAKALSTNARIVIMDEPTSALTDTEVSTLFGIIRGLKEQQLGVIFISHRIEEVLEICDRITVLRDGHNAGEIDTREATPARIVQMMVGRPLSDLFQKEISESVGEPVLEVRGLSRATARGDTSATSIHDISFSIRAGEIVGLAGLVGSGRTELARSIFGADRIDSGAILVGGREVSIKHPLDAISLGLGLVPEDRKQQALVLELPIRENISLANLAAVTRAGFVNRVKERAIARRFIDALQVRTPSMEQRVINLSGGNQQKVVLAKWLTLEPKVLIVDEPTRGIDVGAKAEVHLLLSKLASQGVGILMISSELPEIIAMSDRVLVMREGRIAGELTRQEATQESIMSLATGLDRVRVAAIENADLQAQAV